MKKTVKIALIIASAAVLLSLTACSGDSKVSGKASSTNSEPVQSNSIGSSESERENPDNEDFSREIAPFFWTEFENEFSVCLNVGEYLQDVFDSRADEGFKGSGYDWENLAMVFIEEKIPDLIDKVEFDSEAGMFCALSKDA